MRLDTEESTIDDWTAEEAFAFFATIVLGAPPKRLYFYENRKPFGTHYEFPETKGECPESNLLCATVISFDDEGNYSNLTLEECNQFSYTKPKIV